MSCLARLIGFLVGYQLDLFRILIAEIRPAITAIGHPQPAAVRAIVFVSLVDYRLDIEAAGLRHLVSVLTLALCVCGDLGRAHLLLVELLLVPVVLGLLVLVLYRLPGPMYEFQRYLCRDRVPLVV